MNAPKKKMTAAYIGNAIIFLNVTIQAPGLGSFWMSLGMKERMMYGEAMPRANMVKTNRAGMGSRPVA